MPEAYRQVASSRQRGWARSWLSGWDQGLNGLHKAAERVLLQFVPQMGGFCGDGSRDVVPEDILGLCVRLGGLVAARLAVVAAKAAATEE